MKTKRDRMKVRRVYLDRGGYARAGANVYPGVYFGVGAPVYEYEIIGPDHVRSYVGTVRAATRESALEAIRRKHGV